ncbi:hypothetical protein AMTRI_Chr04g181670 [Amborella trichopoda]|uniref:U-box domain-containing protein n=1 Tax=Amborella trichopoda TaxID=13333 RepID=W1NEM8_AMBTC|nr:U-box domain-containing protein 21 [Amborella trichopoda]ERM93829.1 hypothetical protein AMTR_s00138p00053700 [Amborella trichopoda]|eukprot:XP_006826592.1 U-box domain-containing protein 21 [Amborella trichopoda]
MFSRRSKLPEKLKPGIKSIQIPSNFKCPISLELMRDPVIMPTGITYDRQSIERWLDEGGKTCPVTNQPVHEPELIPNHALRRMIQSWCVANSSNGVDRIPTPKIPISEARVSEILSEISVSSDRNLANCLKLVRKLKISVRESERNRRCVASSQAGRVLASIFLQIAGKSRAGNSDCRALMEEIMALLMVLTPLTLEAFSFLSSREILLCLIEGLRQGNLELRKNSALLIKEIASNGELTIDFRKIDGLFESLLQIIRDPICSSSLKASLITVFYVCSSDEEIRAKAVKLGFISAILDILPDSDRSVCEKAMAAIDALCKSKEGRAKASEHALMVPLVVKKIFRVSDLVTELSVTVLWRLCKDEECKLKSVSEALQVGAFQKLLLLLQVGCEGKIKEKVTDLLKVTNSYRERWECVDSGDFKGLKRPF